MIYMYGLIVFSGHTGKIRRKHLIYIKFCHIQYHYRRKTITFQLFSISKSLSDFFMGPFMPIRHKFLIYSLLISASIASSSIYNLKHG